MKIVMIMFFLGYGLLFGYDYFPKTVVLELAVSSTSEDAGIAYDKIVDLQNNFNYGELIPIRYYSSDNSGEYSSPLIDDLISSYSISEYPSLIVNGKSKVEGTSFPITDKPVYESFIDNYYYSPSPFMIAITSFNKITGDISVNLTKLSELSFSGIVRLIIIEDEVAAGVTNLARTYFDINIDMSNEDSEELITHTFELDSGWNTANLELAAYIKNNEGEILQANSTYTNTHSFVRAVFPESQTTIGVSDGITDTPQFSVFYFGTPANMTINIRDTNAPDGWFFTYCDEIGSCYFGPYNFDIENGVERKFYATIMPSGIGMMDYEFFIESDSFNDLYTIPLRFITDDVDYLLLDDDGWENYEDRIVAALPHLNIGVWSTRLDKPSQELSNYFDTILWLGGENDLSSDNINFLEIYLNAGNNLLLSGQNIINNSSFLQNHLNTQITNDNANRFELFGITNDPISNGLAINLNGGTSPNNQYAPSALSVHNPATGYEFLYYNDETAGAIRSHTDSRTIFFGFGLEGISSNENLSQLLTNSLNWLESDLFVEEEFIAAPVMLQSYPNPFNPIKQDLVISLTMSDNHTSITPTLKIYNIKGQLLNVFKNIELEDRMAKLYWDGKDTNGIPAANGIYFAVLENGSEKAINKILILK